MAMSDNKSVKPPKSKRSRRAMAIALSTIFAGGTLFSSCQTRFRDDAVQGSKDFLSTLLNPTNIVDLLLGSGADANANSNGN